MIDLNQALRAMHRLDQHGKPVPFSVTFCTANRRKNTGGELLELDGVILTWTDKKQASKALNEMETDKSRKPTNHYRNRTRNFLLPNGQIRKAHISLITQFNGHQVL